jgi:hypothetical protein
LQQRLRQQALEAITAIEEGKRSDETSGESRGRRRRVSFCPECGQRVSPKAKFCGGCGTDLRKYLASAT